MTLVFKGEFPAVQALKKGDPLVVATAWLSESLHWVVFTHTHSVPQSTPVRLLDALESQIVMVLNTLEIDPNEVFFEVRFEKDWTAAVRVGSRALYDRIDKMVTSPLARMSHMVDDLWREAYDAIEVKGMDHEGFDISHSLTGGLNITIREEQNEHQTTV